MENDILSFQDENDFLIFDDEDTPQNKRTGSWNILIVDDEAEVHNISKLVLNDFEFDNKTLNFISAYSGEEAKRIMRENDNIAVILLDVVMETEDAGLRVVKYVREELGNDITRIILRTGQPGQAPEKRIVVDYDIDDYKEKTELTSVKLFTTLVSVLRTYRNMLKIDSTNKQLQSLNVEIENTQKEIVFTLGEVAEARSKETGNHVKRVAEYSYILAKALGLSTNEAELIKVASPMHDIGKLAIPDNILNKPGKLTSDEFELMKAHSNIGYDLLKNSNRQIFRSAAIIALQHHEKFNGKGYPHGLKGEEIHVYGRITAVADVFDALGSDRVYKKAWELDRILNLFKEERGDHFDPKLVDVFFKNIDKILIVRDRFKDV
ncbi:MAG: HD domain-containing protein [Bacillota bacterium]|nr:HD domain-containing protein [Bacillota bacterium]